MLAEQGAHLADCLQEGDDTRAHDLFAEALVMANEIDYLNGAVDALPYLGALARARGDLPAARASIRRALVDSRRAGDEYSVLHVTSWAEGQAMTRVQAVVDALTRMLEAGPQITLLGNPRQSGRSFAPHRRNRDSASSASSRTISAGDWTLFTALTDSPAHIGIVSIAPVVPRLIARQRIPRVYFTIQRYQEVVQVAQLNVKLADENLQALRRYAAKRRTPVAWLIKDYVAYLLAGGSPVLPPATDTLSPLELAALAERGGAFDWLADEPDLYSLDDGEPV